MMRVGQLVKMRLGPNRDSFGVVEHINDSHVRVKWEDGQIGLLYWDRTMVPCAYRLEAVRCGE